MNTEDDLRQRLARPAYPRAAGYDPRLLIETAMGPNPLWLMEALTQVLPPAPGMRVLDLGCGRATTSIFLAKEFGVRVTAADLWIKPGENWARIQAAGLADAVMPLRAEAHALPFADGYFDAIVSVDAYHYFGTDDLYLAYVTRFLRPGGRLGIVVPGLVADLEASAPPEHLRAHWERDFNTFHSPAWWRRHWERGGGVDVEVADAVPGGFEDWLLWSEVCVAEGRVRGQGEVDLLKADLGRTLCFARAVARAK